MNLESAIEQLRDGACAGVFIDDTGSPGLQNTPKHLHAHRKSWVAVVVPQQHMSQIMMILEGSLQLLDEHLQVKEFHSIDIYQGKRSFAEVPFEDRMVIFECLANVINGFQLPIFVQTLDPENPVVAHFRKQFPESAGPLDFHNYEDLSLLMLLIRLKEYFSKELPEERARVFMDQGRFKSGGKITYKTFCPPFLDGEIHSADSVLLHPIQLADFAAFGLNRTQLLIGRNDLNSRDSFLLSILSIFARNYKNIDVVTTDKWPPFPDEELNKLSSKSEGVDDSID